MKLMSFFLTQEQILSGTKTVTRRLGWKNLKPGELIQAVEKGQGLKKGEKVKKLRVIEIVSVRQEPLYQLVLIGAPHLVDPWYGRKEVEKEGFRDYLDPKEFINMFCQHNKCTPETIVTRIEFKYYNSPML